MPVEEFRYADRETGPLTLRVFDVPLVGLSINGFGSVLERVEPFLNLERAQRVRRRLVALHDAL